MKKFIFPKVFLFSKIFYRTFQELNIRKEILFACVDVTSHTHGTNAWRHVTLNNCICGMNQESVSPINCNYLCLTLLICHVF